MPNKMVVIEKYGIPEQLWVSDRGDGSYHNPILYADYSDPDVIRVGNDYYMVASSFNFVPGLPVLHSKDLVNWQVVSYVVSRLPFANYDQPEYGKGVWAPSIRYHDEKFWVYFATPDEGIFMSTTTDPHIGWQPLTYVKKTKGWIDPCPFWDDDGNAYLVNAFAKSRIGFKSILHLTRMKPDGTELLDEGVHIFDGNLHHPTIEGPKMYKRNGFYYIFAPAGGVKPGWQTVLRAENVFGPYEDRIAMHQGKTQVNGPHQGGWVETATGEHWFIHFQDRDAYGRITHLQPLRWVNDWPVIGEDRDGDGIGEPVTHYKKPTGTDAFPIITPKASDNFDDAVLGLQWQWNANPQANWFSLVERPGWLRLYAKKQTNIEKPLLYHSPNLLTQLFQAPSFTSTAKLEFLPEKTGDMAGLAILGNNYAYIAIEKTAEGNWINYYTGSASDGEPFETKQKINNATDSSVVFLRVKVEKEAVCTFSYSLDGKEYVTVKEAFQAVPGGWVGSKTGIFARNFNDGDSTGFADFDWFIVDKNEDENHRTIEE